MDGGGVSVVVLIMVMGVGELNRGELVSMCIDRLEVSWNTKNQTCTTLARGRSTAGRISWLYIHASTDVFPCQITPATRTQGHFFDGMTRVDVDIDVDSAEEGTCS
jgi:hypothetical protein